MKAMCVARDAERKFRDHHGANSVGSNSSAYKHLQARGGNQEGTVQKSILESILAQQIPCQLQAISIEANPKDPRSPPLELVGSLVKGDTPHPFD